MLVDIKVSTVDPFSLMIITDPVYKKKIGQWCVHGYNNQRPGLEGLNTVSITWNLSERRKKGFSQS